MPDPATRSLNPYWDEVAETIPAMLSGAARYYRKHCAFPEATALTPAAGTCCGARGGPDADGDGLCDDAAPFFTTAAWRALGARPPTPHAFVYETATRPDGQFEVVAHSDIDCDGVQSTVVGFVRPLLTAPPLCLAIVLPGFFTDYEVE